MIQDHSFKHQLIRDILTAIGTIVIFVWIIFSYKLYKQIFLINILDAAVWKLWHVWFNFGCFKHICALKLIKYLRDPLKECKTLHSVIYYTVQRLCLKFSFSEKTTKFCKLSSNCFDKSANLLSKPCYIWLQMVLFWVESHVKFRVILAKLSWENGFYDKSEAANHSELAGQTTATPAVTPRRP